MGSEGLPSRYRFPIPHYPFPLFNSAVRRRFPVPFLLRPATNHYCIMSTGTLAVLRRILLVTLLLSIVGVEAELLLLEHFDGTSQWLPLVLLAICLLTLGWYGVSRGRASIRAVQGAMVLCVVLGAVGVWLHLDGNIEFEREMSPGMAGFALFKAAMMGATPSLAPGAMIQLGLIGLAWTFRHPALSTRTDSFKPRTGD
jgi:hypothetical protein